MLRRFMLFFVALLSFSGGALAYGVGTPIATDSRIKTFVFNENDVYRLLTHYGYQLNIEFGNKEEIETISVGDRTGWQIIPAGQRLFVRGMEDKAHTNMTVVTNRHAYQFDLYSSPPGEQGWDELVYVVRFYYPEDQDIQTAAMGGGGYSNPYPSYAPPQMPYGQAPYNPAAYGAAPYGSSPISMTASAPMAPMSSMGSMAYPPAMTSASPYNGYSAPAPVSAQNYNYSFTGEQSILPSQMYDDGQRTYLVFPPNQMMPQISMVSPDGREQSAPVGMNGQNVTVQGVYARLVLRVGNSRACVYNETMAR